ncbi:hypothetical protein FITA111629_11935 [Filibacter tadaridae]|uniref:Inner spore coat protein D n=2 Tax=Filibacter tadaridae TaxID=2483811 RepID=A0A3P5W9F3_9BACL|nr:hypothetical protein FILTAD_00114 [Filibacter tadaridae]
MQQWNNHDHMMQGGNYHGNMMHGGNWNNGMVQPVVCPTQYRCHDQFMPREVPYIHPIVNVNRQHIVEVPQHYYTETTQNVMGETLQARPGFGPQSGGYGPRGGGRGRRRWR